MEKMTVEQLIQATGAKAAGSRQGEVNQIVRDSRQVGPGSLFVAIAGENIDGHRFVGKAWEAGAQVVLAQQESQVLPETPEERTLLLVPDTIQAMGQIARYYKNLFSVPTVAVTGSVGKTSCKDMVAAALSGSRKTIKTQENFNNHIGVPLTIFQIDHTTEAAVIEMGMNHFGEIDYAAGLVEPDYGIITNIGISHIENLGSQQGILQAKLEMIPHIKGKGPVFLNGDDPLLWGIRGKLPVETEYFGYGPHNDARVLETALTEEAHLRLKLEYRGEAYELTLNTMGRHMAFNALPAIMTAVHMGLTKEEILRGFARFTPTRHRLEAIQTPQYLILDDTYNASPDSMCGALEAMREIPSKHRRVAILGDMFELGEYAQAGHERVGRFIAEKANLQVLVCCGEQARWIYEAAKLKRDLTCYYFEDRESMQKKLFTIIQKDDIILLKASHGMAFTAICEEIVKHE